MTLSTLNLSRTTPRSRAKPVLTATLAMIAAGVMATGYAMGQAESVDTDGDGMVSYTELMLVMPDLTEEEFAALDANADGMLDAEEVTAAEDAGLITMG